MKRKHTIEEILYYWGLALLLPLIIGLPVLFQIILPNMPSFHKECVMLTITGIYCPGCGGTRAVIALFRGQFFKSFCYHPMVIYSAIIYLVYMITHTLERISFGRIKGVRFRPWYLYGALAILAVNFLIKNILKFCFGIFME